MISLVQRFLPVGAQRIRKFEAILGHVLPADYFNFLATIRGWHVAIALLVQVPGLDEKSYISRFYAVSGDYEPDEDQQVGVPEIQPTHPAFPREFLVLADATGGNYVIDLRSESKGQIYYRDRELELNLEPFLSADFFEERSLDEDERFRYVKIADNFTEFVNLIYTELDEE